MEKKNATNKSWQNFIPDHFFTKSEKASSLNTVIGQLVGKSMTMQSLIWPHKPGHTGMNNRHSWRH